MTSRHPKTTLRQTALRIVVATLVATGAVTLIAPVAHAGTSSEPFELCGDPGGRCVSLPTLAAGGGVLPAPSRPLQPPAGMPSGPTCWTGSAPAPPPAPSARRGQTVTVRNEPVRDACGRIVGWSQFVTWSRTVK
jgi:hypothetical protein